MRGSFAATLVACLGVAAPAVAQEAPGPAPVATPAVASQCADGVCQLRITPEALLARAEALVRERRFAEAAPLIEALGQAPQMKVPSRFLAGYSASEQGDYKRAADIFKDILSDDPNQTRVRLELGRAMLGLGQTASADRQFRIAEQDELPPEIADLVRGARAVIRSQRLWRLNADLGIAPDSNINNATAADSVNIQLGDLTLPIEIDPSSQARSGTGLTAQIDAGARLPFSGRAAILVDLFANGTNYQGAAFDDYWAQIAVGPQLHLSDQTNISLQALGAQRWFGGSTASRQAGARLGFQTSLGARTRLGLQLDGRRTTAAFDSNFSGWQLGLYANGERTLSRTIVATAGLFARREWLTAQAYSNRELGASAGLAGELPMGMNFGANVVVSRALFDAPMPIFSNTARSDWRWGGTLTLGNRKLRFLGFSPSVQISYNRLDSTLAYFANDRLRTRFALARYF